MPKSQTLQFKAIKKRGVRAKERVSGPDDAGTVRKDKPAGKAPKFHELSLPERRRRLKAFFDELLNVQNGGPDLDVTAVLAAMRRQS